ncbi:probable polyketide synthase 1 [Saccostrea echinata]|uniref:probable polyketide synthase 1 n=1 Tax=Saccostrea echinata TaxID=191078 RepID=UPI002A805AA0|nr:probable polyketide synthase 1 [Saccostrea echinata]
MAICGGINVLLSPTMPIVLAKARMASETGKCHTFSKNADGYTRGEGCGIVILKRLAVAIRDNNKIWGIVATACNQDGQENSPITAPAGVQQVKLLERIFKKTAIHPSSIQYIEAHGTGTPVGDPIEVNALGDFFSSHFNGHNIRIGSVKTNIGHLESAAGVAGLIKVLLMMKHCQFVPSLNAEELNENIPFESYKFVVGKDNAEWKKDLQGCRLASINCFGFGGTNSHAIVYNRENLSLLRKTNKDSTKDVLFPNHRVVVVSAVTRKSLKEIIQDLRQNLNEKLEDISYTSVLRREHFKYRELIVANSISNLNDQLKYVAKNDDQTVSGTFSKSQNIVFVFCGVGTTWTGMCAEMIAKNPVFRKSVIEIDTYLEKLNANMSMYKTIQNKKEIYNNPMKTHIAIFTIQIALAASWRHIGISPSAVVGQSVGEVAAAYECGSLSLEDAVTVIYHRSLALTACQNGAMMVIRNCATEEVNQACTEISRNSRNKVNIAVYNSQQSSTVSGDNEALERLKTRLPSDALFIPLNAPCAYHSHHTKQASEHLFEMLQSLRPNTPRVRIFSTVEGKEIQTDFASAKYWASNVLQSVLFMQAMKSVKDELKDLIILEIGPRPVFQAHVSNVFSDNDVTVLPSVQKYNDTKTFLNSLNALFGKGVTPLWENITEMGGCLSAFPRYIFNRLDFSLNSDMVNRLTQENSLEGHSGRMIRFIPGTNGKFNIYISRSNTPFVYEHVVENRIIVPGALYGETALEIGRTLLTGNVENLEISWKIKKPLEIAMNEQKSLHIDTDLVSPQTVDFKVRESQSSWILAEGRVMHVEQEDSVTLDVAGIGTRLAKKSSNDIYKFLNTLGFKHGPTFRIISEFQTSKNECLAEIVLTKNVQMDMPRACFHPVLIDGMFQSCINPNSQSGFYHKSRILPTEVKKFRVKQAPTSKMSCFSRLVMNENSKLVSNAILVRENGLSVAEMEGFEMKIISDEDDIHKLFFEEKWHEIILPTNNPAYSKPSLVFSWNKKAIVETRQTLCRTCSNLDIVSLTCDAESENFLSSLKEKRDVDLYFIPGFSKAENDANGNHVLEAVKKSSHILLKVLQEIDMKTTSLCVITEWTQGGEEREIYGIFGSELWGISRSFQKEHPDFKLIMIDLHGNLNDLQNSFLTVINAVKNDKQNVLPREYVISSTGVLSKKIQNIPSNYFDNAVKTIEPSTENAFSVRKRSELDNNTLFLVSSIESSNTDKENCNVSIQEALLCFKNKLFLQQKTIPITEYWGKSFDIGNAVVACEFIGHITKNGIQVVGCCLVNVASTITVNRLCICELSEVPFYRTGMFLNTAVAMSLAGKIDKKNHVFILYDKQYKDITDILKALLQKKHCIVLTEVFDASKDSQDPTASKLIVLSKQVVCSFDVILRWFPKLQQLLSIKGFLPLSTTSINPIKYPSRKSCLIDVYEIFEPTNMQKHFIQAKRILLENRDIVSRMSPQSSDCILNLSSMKGSTKIEVPNEMLVRKDSAYIVIGGLSGLGWEVTKFLAARGAKVVVSLSRRTPSDVENRRIENTKNIRNTVILHDKVDITQRKDLEHVFSRLARQLEDTKIRGVFHGAGVLRDQPISKMTSETFDIPLIPKILGTWNLHLVTKEMDLDYFVMHSSIVSLFGNKSQANYAAGNAFMDAFAYYRRSTGKAAQVINWGLLAVGMGADQNIQSVNAMNGLYDLPKHKIIFALHHALVSNRVQFAFADINISLSSEGLEKEGKEIKQNNKQTMIQDLNLVNKESSRSKEELLQSWIDFVKLSASSVLSVDHSEIKDSSVLLDFGLDSQKAIELINYLFESSHIRLPVVYLMSGKNTIVEIAEYFLSRMSKEDGTKDDDFIYESLSYLEQHYLELQENDPDNPHLLITLDFTVFWELNCVEIWKVSLLNLIAFNPECRTILQETGPGMKRGNKRKCIIDIEDVCFNFITVSSKSELEKVSSDISKFDPYEDIPIKAIFWKSPGFGVLRILLNHSNFDNGCIMVIAKDLEYITTQYLLHRRFSEEIVRQPIDSALLMEKHLNERIDELRAYWDQELSKCREPQSFRLIEKVEDERGSNISEVIRKHFEVNQLQKFEEVATRHQITLFSLFCTAFQLSLRKQLNCQRPCVITAVDTRLHFPEFLERPTLCVNYIPIVSPDLSNPKSTLHDILNENKTVIAEGVSKSLFPFKLLKELPNFKEELHTVHSIIMEDFTIWKAFNISHIKLSNFNVEQDSSYETNLSVIIQPDRSLELRMRYSVETVGRYYAENILENIEMILEYIVSDFNFCINNWRSFCKMEQKIESSTYEHFFLYDRKGKATKKKIEIRQHPSFTLEWGKRRRRKVSISEIKFIRGFNTEDFYGIFLKTVDSGLRLAVKDRRTRDAWIAVLKRKKSEYCEEPFECTKL